MKGKNSFEISIQVDEEKTITARFGIDRDLVEEYGKCYFPLTQNTIDILTNSMTAEEKEQLKKLLMEDEIRTEAVEALYSERIKSSILLAQSGS